MNLPMQLRNTAQGHWWWGGSASSPCACWETQCKDTLTISYQRKGEENAGLELGNVIHFQFSKWQVLGPHLQYRCGDHSITAALYESHISLSFHKLAVLLQTLQLWWH